MSLICRALSSLALVLASASTSRAWIFSSSSFSLSTASSRSLWHRRSSSSWWDNWNDKRQHSFSKWNITEPSLLITVQYETIHMGDSWCSAMGPQQVMNILYYCKLLYFVKLVLMMKIHLSPNLTSIRVGGRFLGLFLFPFVEAGAWGQEGKYYHCLGKLCYGSWVTNDFSAASVSPCVCSAVVAKKQLEKIV